MKILVTGAAGFIGFHLAKRLLDRGDEVVGLDNLNDYYDVNLKRARLERLQPDGNFTFIKADVADRAAVEKLFAEHEFDRVLHMAAQAGVRYSLTNPYAYVDSNIVGFLNLLEACRRAKVPHLVYASSSSVYGSNTKLPFSTGDNVDHPISLYAATKKADELMAHAYSHLYGIPTTGLRFFTVYGPWGRPDMAYFKFTKAISAGEPIDVYNEGKMKRDFTYIDDAVEAVVRVIDHIPNSDGVPYKLYNVGSHDPVSLMEFIGTLEKALGDKAKRNLLPAQPGDVLETYADVEDLKRDVGFAPKTPMREGIVKFVEWYKSHFKG